LLVLIRAVETRDVDTVTRHIYFDTVRISLTNQVTCAAPGSKSVRLGET
jgi:hypothetical protein